LHGKDNVVFERLILSLVENHNTDEVNIGVVENLRLVGRKLKGVVRLGNSKRAEELKRDILDGIVTNLSIGYRIIQHHMQGDDLIADKWSPYECSIVAVGADPLAGIGRSYSFGENDMTEATQKPKKSENRDATVEAARKARAEERARVDAISKMAREFNEDALGQRHISAGSSVDQFNEDLLASVRRKSGGHFTPGSATIADEYNYGSGPYVHTGGGQRGFSIANLIKSQLDPRGVDAGYELEVSDELKRRHGKRGSQLLVPLGRSQIPHNQRAMTVGTATAGGHLVATDLHSDQFIDALIPASTVMNLGIMQLADLQGDVAIPRADSNPGVSAYSLDSADTITPTDATLSQVTLSPRSLAATTVMSHKLVTQGSPDVEALVQQMLAAAIGAELDRQCIQGDGTGSNITGVVNVTGIGALTYANGGSPTWANVVNLESELAVDNVAMNNIAYLVHPTMAATLKTTEKASGTARFLMEDGMMNSHPVHVTTNVPAGTVLIGAWGDFILGTWGVMAIDVDIYSGFRKGDVEVRCILDYDAAVRHAQGFAVATEAPV
jgi:HK97 family phage major capsid protein